MSYESERADQRENTILPQEGKDRTLSQAINDFKAVLRTGGQSDGDDDYLDRSDQIRLVEGQAERLGFLYDGLQPNKIGGKEHDLRFDELSNTVLKFTKPSQAAFSVIFFGDRPKLSPGDPLEYLERLELHSQVFGDFTDFVGIGGDKNNRRIITRQPIAEGVGASWDEILGLMIDELGFAKLRHTHGIGYEDSYAFIRDDIAVFDIRPANVIKTIDDYLVAIDSIPVRVSDSQREYLMSH